LRMLYPRRTPSGDGRADPVQKQVPSDWTTQKRD